MKECPKCGLSKELDCFSKRTKSSDGLYYSCKQCVKASDSKRREDPIVRNKQVEANRNNRNKNRQRLYDYMLNKNCILCQEDDIACLQFDHRDSNTKLFNISDSLGRSWSSLMNEIDKCDILCANCHAKRTAIQQNWYSTIKISA